MLKVYRVIDWNDRTLGFVIAPRLRLAANEANARWGVEYRTLIGETQVARGGVTSFGVYHADEPRALLPWE